MITSRKELFKSISLRGQDIFLAPSATYSFDSIVLGCDVFFPSGRYEKMYAVARNTWRGFHKIDKEGVGVANVFMSYFILNKNSIISSLKEVNNQSQLDMLEDNICRDIRNNLNNIRQDMLSKLLFLPLDSQMFQSSYLFDDLELHRHNLSRNSTFKDIYSENQYNKLQELLQLKANAVCKEIGQPFFRIYFDLLWNERYLKEGTNLFLTNP